MVLRSEGQGFPKLEERPLYMINLDGLFYHELFYVFLDFMCE